MVADLSFISLRLVLPLLARLAAEEADLVLLVKPQFEARPQDVGRGGVVRDQAVWRRALEGVVGACEEAGFRPVGAMASPLPGPAGNVEFPLHARRGPGAPILDLGPVLAEGRTVAASSKGRE